MTKLSKLLIVIGLITETPIFAEDEWHHINLISTEQVKISVDYTVEPPHQFAERRTKSAWINLDLSSIATGYPYCIVSTFTKVFLTSPNTTFFKEISLEQVEGSNCLMTAELPKLTVNKRSCYRRIGCKNMDVEYQLLIYHMDWLIDPVSGTPIFRFNP